MNAGLILDRAKRFERRDCAVLRLTEQSMSPFSVFNRLGFDLRYPNMSSGIHSESEIANLLHLIKRIEN